MKYLQSSNGNEYTFKKFRRYCKEEGILLHLTIIYTLQQNAIAEQPNQIILEKVCSIFSQSSLLHEFWAKAINIAVSFINLSPSKAINFLTPCKIRHKYIANHC
jgi:hypothetical protein